MSKPVYHGCALLALGAALLGGCNLSPRLAVRPVGPPRVETPREPATERPTTKVRMLSPGAEAAANERRTPVVPATPEAIAALVGDRQVSVTLPPQPLTQFIDTVFGQVLELPYFTGPGVARRRDMVTLSGPVAMPARQFFGLVQTALRQYGLAVAIENGAVRIVEDDLLAWQAPLFMKARSLPETPAGSRPVLRFATFENVGVTPVAQLLSQTFSDRGAVQFAAEQSDNGIVISGNPQDVEAAAQLARTFDRPDFAGAQVARIEPVFWSAQALADAVRNVLATEGYSIGIGDGSSTSFLPIPFANSILLFSGDPALFKRALYWAQELDSPSAFADQEGVYIYTARNTTAAELGALVAQVTPGAEQVAEVSRTQPLIGERSELPRAEGMREQRERAKPVTNGRITIDPGGNRLLFRGKRSEFATLRALMAELDTPPKQVLVEITIAEVSLTDETRFGMEWFLDTALGGGNLQLDTRGGLPREAGGLGATFTRTFSKGTVESALNAIATNRNLNILSTPRLVARSGSEAQILIGSDVPIITSQRAADNQSNGDTDILQTVQYRQTGVILNVRPIVFGSDRVDIELFQEVSNQQINEVSPIASPLIQNRSVTTQLSLREGMTAVIGGLIQDDYGRIQKGVPLLKDIPLLGQAFRSDGVSGNKTELLILVTPYIIRSDDQMGETSATYAGSINSLLRERGPQVYTLLPWRFGTSRVHGGALEHGKAP